MRKIREFGLRGSFRRHELVDLLKVVVGESAVDLGIAVDCRSWIDRFR